MKILGLDLGTNSIGWAVVEKDFDEFHLIDKGVRIFQEGVKIEKGIEGSKAAERTSFRSARRLKFRRKLRKINTLKVLIKFGYCPFLSLEELDKWRYEKIYPDNLEFRNWWLTDENSNKTPYYFRYLAVNQKMDLSIQDHRFMLGRAFYHMAQRRGFLSNRLEGTKESDGAVKQGISQINEEKGSKTLGHYFYEKYLNGEKIRDTYTHRNEHYLEEFNAISDFQGLPEDLRRELQRAIFFQRPLKSQKGIVGKCVFEKSKSRCPVSRPEFEEFRMLCFINNIKIKSPDDEKLRFLTEIERNKIFPLFYRKSKDHFDFEDIAKALAPKNQYSYYKSSGKKETDWLLNYNMKTSVSACPVSARFKVLFGDDFYNFSVPYKREKDGHLSSIDLNDVWHVLFCFDSDSKLEAFARIRLGFSEEQVQEFLKIKMKKDYAALSLKAINNILPFLKQGLIYSHSVFLANMNKIIPEEVWALESNRKLIKGEVFNIISSQNTEKQIIDIVNGYIQNCRRELSTWSKEAEALFQKDLTSIIKDYYGPRTYEGFSEEKKIEIEGKAFNLFMNQMPKNFGRGDFAQIPTIDERVKNFLHDNFDVTDDDLEKLYHPSSIEVYKPPVRGKDGHLYLGSPMVSSIRNPMAMRSLHQLRKVINELIRVGKIDQNTRIHIELARDLMNANERKALQSWQRDRERLRDEYSKKIKNDCGFGDDYVPSQEEILKYQLWEEQNHKCIYTGNEISLCEFLGPNPSYDVEHTIPRSLSFDNSQENKTLCDNKFNRSVKRNKIPAELTNHDDILQRIDHWREKYEDLTNLIQVATRQARAAVDKESKDRAIQKRHKLTFEMNYWRNKYNRFVMKDVPAGFKNSQLVDTGIITKYARLYLNTYFDRVLTVKGSTVADFRTIWGLQEEYEKKERVNHIHHCVDAITMACMTKENYELLAKFYHDWEETEYAGYDKKPKIVKPWPTFAEDLKEIENEVLISHYTPDVLPKKAKKKLKIRGKIKRNEKGEPVYLQGDSVRGSLHKETNYGAIKRSVIDKEGNTTEKIVFVSRKPLDSLTPADINNIVDENVRTIVAEGKAKEEPLKKELDKWTRLEKEEDDPIRKTQFSEKVSELKLQLESLFRIENKNGSFTPIKKVRCVATTVTNPLDIKRHRDVSKHDYKHYSHFANDSNYVMGIYEGLDNKEKIKRDFLLVNNLDAAKYYNGKSEEDLLPEIHPKSDLLLKYLLKIGSMVILWETSAKEVWDLNISEVTRRMYKVIGMSLNTIRQGEKKWLFGNIVLRHITEARPATDLRTQDGLFRSNEDYIPQRKLSHNQFNALVEGFDFYLSPIGELKKIEK
jgi:CRISPR-associated endonuclease Csn1